MASSSAADRPRGIPVMPVIAFRLGGFLSPDVREALLRTHGPDWLDESDGALPPLDQMRKFLDRFRASGQENMLAGATLLAATFDIDEQIAQSVWNWWATYVGTPDTPSRRFLRDGLAAADQPTREHAIKALGGQASRAWLGMLEPEAQAELNATWHTAAVIRLQQLQPPRSTRGPRR